MSNKDLAIAKTADDNPPTNTSSQRPILQSKQPITESTDVIKTTYNKPTIQVSQQHLKVPRCTN